MKEQVHRVWCHLDGGRAAFGGRKVTLILPASISALGLSYFMFSYSTGWPFEILDLCFFYLPRSQYHSRGGTRGIQRRMRSFLLSCEMDFRQPVKSALLLLFEHAARRGFRCKHTIHIIRVLSTLPRKGECTVFNVRR